MTKDFKTDQEKFWAGNFGDDYASRNMGEKFLASQVAFFTKILTKTQKISSVIEFGANIGVNLQAIHELLPEAKLSALEINASAVKQIREVVKAEVEIYGHSILDFKPEPKWDLVFVKGVLIHINPEKLEKVYDILYQSSKRYILLAEYYNPKPVVIDYRGHKDRLFKRDFCGEIMDKFPDLKLIDYGFAYHRDNNFPQDDITWFLLEKNSK